MKHEEIRFIDLFAGIGGFRYGLERCNSLQPKRKGNLSRGKNNAKQNRDSEYRTRRGGKDKPNFRCVYTNEWDRYAAQIYNKNFYNSEETQVERDQKSRSDSSDFDGESRTLWGSKSSSGVDTRDIRTVDASTLPDFDLLCGGFPCQAFSIAGKRRGFDDTRGTLFFEIARILREKKPRLCLLENVKGLLSHDNGNTFKTIISTLTQLGYDIQWQVLNSKNFGVPQNRERVFIIGHLRGTPRPKVFPVGESDSIPDKENRGQQESRPGVRGEISSTIDTRYGALRNAGETYMTSGTKIRRLTPVECERLQGFPDGWTEGISDTQRYKCLGNAVTVNVVEYIGKKILLTTT